MVSAIDSGEEILEVREGDMYTDCLDGSSEHGVWWMILRALKS